MNGGVGGALEDSRLFSQTVTHSPCCEGSAGVGLADESRAEKDYEILARFNTMEGADACFQLCNLL